MHKPFRRAIAILHVDFEDLGTLRGALEQRGFVIDTVDAPTADWDALALLAPDLVIVLGGPLGTADEATYPFLTKELAYIKQCLQSHIAMIGICLGAQLIAKALGAEVQPLGVKEIGFEAIDLSPAGLKSPLWCLTSIPVLHWHGDQFAIPHNASNLASTKVGRHQAFALGKTVLALQFHLEVDTRYIERWLVGNSCELAQAGLDPRLLRADAQKFGAKLATAANRVFGTWLDIAFQP